MFSICKADGTFKTAVIAYRTHGSEFLIYETDFAKFRWEDLYQNRLCILTVKPTINIHRDLQDLLNASNFTDYVLIKVIV